MAPLLHRAAITSEMENEDNNALSEYSNALQTRHSLDIKSK